jgi:hypothetical protein
MFFDGRSVSCGHRFPSLCELNRVETQCILPLAINSAQSTVLSINSALNADYDADEVYARCTALRHSNFKSKTKPKNGYKHSPRLRKVQALSSGKTNGQKSDCTGSRRGYKLST